MLIIFNKSDLYFDMNFRDAIVLAIGEEKEGQPTNQVGGGGEGNFPAAIH